MRKEVKPYMSIQEHRNNDRLDSEIEHQIAIWDGTIRGLELKNMYENGSSYEAICDRFDIDYSEFEE